MIKLTCTNEDCGTTFSVKDEHAGKKARCPKCKTVIDIPAAQDDSEEKTEERVRPGRGSSASAVQSKSSAKDRRADPDVDDEEEDQPKSRRGARDDDEEDDDDRPKKKKAVADADDEDDDDRPNKKKAPADEDDDDDDDDRPRKKKARKSPPDVKSAVLIGGVLLCLIVAAISPLTPAYWFHVSYGGMSASGGLFWLDDIFEGIVIIIFAVLLLIGFSAVMIFLFVLEKKVSDLIVTISASIGVGIGLAYFGWMLALAWLYIRMLSHIKGASVFPWFGMMLPFISALAMAGCCAALLMMRRKQLWLGPAAGGGILLGLILMAADGQPWADTPFLGLQSKTHSATTGGIYISP